jgi:hypothetical protein
MPSAVAAFAGCSINQQETCTLTEAFTGLTSAGSNSFTVGGY